MFSQHVADKMMHYMLMNGVLAVSFGYFLRHIMSERLAAQ